MGGGLISHRPFLINYRPFQFVLGLVSASTTVIPAFSLFQTDDIVIPYSVHQS